MNQQTARRRRIRRRRLRGRMPPAWATGISKRTRHWWPITRAITRVHHREQKGWVKV